MDYIGNTAASSIQTDSSGIGGLGPKHIAVLALADAMTKHVKVSQEIFDGVKNLFSEKEVVEIVATIASFNCVAQFMSALEIGL